MSENIFVVKCEQVSNNKHIVHTEVYKTKDVAKKRFNDFLKKANETFKPFKGKILNKNGEIYNDNIYDDCVSIYDEYAMFYGICNHKNECLKVSVVQQVLFED